jgi:hypothetical protein
VKLSFKKNAWIAVSYLTAMIPLMQSAPTHLVDESPVSIEHRPEGIIFVDFGRVSFGNLRFSSIDQVTGPITIHFGESLLDGRINRKPRGSVRYARRLFTFDGAESFVASPLPDARNTGADGKRHPPVILTPKEWGVVMPFRWVEIEGWSGGELRPEQITRQSAFATTWDDDAATFESSDEMLNQIWELCRYSIKATTFAGVYVDGDRERIPYEADAYLNQISHYYTDNDVQMARDTYDHLMANGTWPTEWAPHMVFMAYADWMQTGDVEWLAPRYDALKEKLLMERVGADGLVQSSPKHINRGDIVDWPTKERDGFVFQPVNTVVNAFHLKAVACMAEMARGIGNEQDALNYQERVQQTHQVFQEQLFDTKSGLYRDGVGTDHTSLHANLFPLAFGLAPEGAQESIAEWLARRGMKCSVYAAQYLMEALFENGAGAEAVELMLAPNDRSWRHMVESGTTITWEAWDQRYKSNQDWNHAWGAAPANLLPRYILGAQALTPGWGSALIRPNLGGLAFAKGKVPTPRGPILIDWIQDLDFRFSINLPSGMSAKLELPVIDGSTGVFEQNEIVHATRVGERWILDQEISGTHIFEVK